MPNESGRLAALAEQQGDPTLLEQMVGLRRTLLRRRWSDLFWRGVLIVGIVVALVLVKGIIDARTSGRAATCAMFQAYTEALVDNSAAPPTQEAHDRFQDRVDSFVAYMNTKGDVIDCVLTPPQVKPAVPPPVPGG